MEYTTCATWRSHKADMEKFRTMPGKQPCQTMTLSLYLLLNGEYSTEIYEIIHQNNIISSEMLRLVQNINFYIMFEVLEVSWKNLLEKLHEAKDMDEIILANEQFLDTIISQLLLDQESVVIELKL